jgi:hypothetical protein
VPIVARGLQLAHELIQSTFVWRLNMMPCQHGSQQISGSSARQLSEQLQRQRKLREIISKIEAGEVTKQ